MASRFKNEAEAKDVLDAKVRELRALGYERLAAMNSTTRSLLRGRVQLGRDPSELVEVHGPSGILYQLETDVAWDDRTGGDLRVFVTVFEECNAHKAMTEDFIVAPGGTFVGG